jgi:2,4-dienoyl-CoA reductase (NADPH2)
VVGAGPAGMTAALVLAQRGHYVSLFDRKKELGGQLNIAVKIPGKTEFYETLRYYRVMLAKHGVKLRLGESFELELLDSGDYDEVILATGVKPRRLNLEGGSGPKVLSYLDLLEKEKPVGNKVAIIGAGGIGIDVAHYLTAKPSFGSEVPEYINRYQLLDSQQAMDLGNPPRREVTVFQRSSEKIGKRLGKTTGWAHLQSLRSHDVKFYNGAEYLRIDDKGLHVKVSTKKGYDPQEYIFEVDQVIVAAGQDPLLELEIPLKQKGFPVHVIGGARETGGLDAKVAISEGAELGAKL